MWGSCFGRVTSQPTLFFVFSLFKALYLTCIFFHGHIHPPHSTVLPFKMSTEPGCSSQWSFISDIYTQRERCLNFLLNRAKWNTDELWSSSFIWDLAWLWANIVHTSVVHIMPFLLSLSPLLDPTWRFSLSNISMFSLDQICSRPTSSNEDIPCNAFFLVWIFICIFSTGSCPQHVKWFWFFKNPF